MLLLTILSTLALTFHGPTAPVPFPASAHKILLPQQPDTAQLLAQTWVLREQQRLGESAPGITPDKMQLTFRPDSTYRLIKPGRTNNGLSELQVVEEGRWTLDTARGLISMQTTSVDGRAMLSTMMPRWQIEEVSAMQLVLQQFISGKVFLLFEAQK